MKNTIFTGAATALVTPFNADLSINYTKFTELMEEQIAAGISALVVCGTTGESSTMTDEEHITCIRHAVKVTNKRVPVIAGTGSNDTAYAIELSKAAEEAGADALLVVSPYYNKTSQRGLIAHFTAIADAVHTPIILYNIPGRTNVNIETDTFVKLAAHRNIAAVKESGGSLEYFARIIAECTDSDHYLDVYSGDDVLTVPAMSIGAKGVISVMSNAYPAVMRDMCALALNNDLLGAGKLQIKHLEVTNALLKLDVNPVPVKAAMNILGKNVGGVRLPLYEMSDTALETLKGILK